MMPLTNTLQQTTLFSSNDFTMPEHFGDDRWTILHGDVMHIVPHMTKSESCYDSLFLNVI